MDRSSRFVFKPLLYELLNGGAQPDEVAPLFSQLLAPYSTNFVQVRELAAASWSVYTFLTGLLNDRYKKSFVIGTLVCLVQGSVKSVELDQTTKDGGSSSGKGYVSEGCGSL